MIAAIIAVGICLPPRTVSPLNAGFPSSRPPNHDGPVVLRGLSSSPPPVTCPPKESFHPRFTMTKNVLFYARSSTTSHLGACFDTQLYFAKEFIRRTAGHCRQSAAMKTSAKSSSRRSRVSANSSAMSKKVRSISSSATRSTAYVQGMT